MKVLAGIGVVIVSALVIAGLWQGGWWVQRNVVQHQAEIREDTFARQTALQQEVLTLHQDITTIDVQIVTATPKQREVLKAQRTAIVNRLCDAYSRMNGTVKIPDDVAYFAGQEC